MDQKSRRTPDTGQEFFGPAFDSVFDHATEGSRRILRSARSRIGMSDDARLVQRQAFAGLLWGKQSYHYDVRRWLEGDPTQPTPDPRAPVGPQPRLDPPLQLGRHLRCRTNGNIRGTPRGTSAFHCVAHGARSIRDFAKDQLVLFLREWYMHPNGQVAGLRMEFLRRESAGARLGGLARLQNRRAHAGKAGPRFPRTRVSQAAAEFHLVGESQGPRGQERLSGRLSRPRQHRRFRPLAAARPRQFHRAIRRHELDGHVSAWTCWRWPSSWRTKIPPTKTWPANSSSISSTSRRP